MQHVDACAPLNTNPRQLNTTTAVRNDASRCGLVCGAADALKESVAVHSAARNKAAASASADFQDILFGEGAERWLHACAAPQLFNSAHATTRRIHYLSSCAADDSQPRSYWLVPRADATHAIAPLFLNPAIRYHAFDKLYEVLLTELHEVAGTSGHEVKHGLQGFLRDAVVCR